MSAAALDWMPRLAQGRLLPGLLVALGLLWIALRLSQALWSWLAPPADVLVVDAFGERGVIDGRRLPLAGFHLFGRAADPSASAYANAPETTLSMTLKGTSSHHEQTRARALIADDKQVEKVYKVGDQISGQVRVQAIYPDRVVLNAAGRIEVLRLRALREGLAPAATARPGMSAAEVATGPSGLVGLNTPPAFAPGSVSNPMVVSAPIDWEAVRQQAIADPASMARAFSVLPVMVDGKLAGVRISSNQYGQQLAAAGLKPDDIVTAVNGRRLDSVEAGLNALESLRTAGAVTITVTRNGAEKTLPAIRMPR